MFTCDKILYIFSILRTLIYKNIKEFLSVRYPEAATEGVL